MIHVSLTDWKLLCEKARIEWLDEKIVNDDLKAKCLIWSPHNKRLNRVDDLTDEQLNMALNHGYEDYL